MTNKLGFVFDLDGTLINSTEIADIIEKQIHEEFNIQTNEKLDKEIDELVLEIIQGENHKNLVKKVMWSIFKKLGLSYKQRIKAMLISSKIFKEEIKKIKLFEGTEELFNFLDDNSYKYAITTTSSTKEVDDRLKKFPEFYKKLDGKIITRDSVKYLKPHPESINKASIIMGVPLKKCVVIGDVHSDIMMGKSVGAVTIGVLTGVFKKENFLKYEPDFIIESVADITKIFEQIKEKIEKNNKNIINN
ncbi:MAG: HAD family hydrolase [Promethearchaeota archaeon]